MSGYQKLIAEIDPRVNARAVEAFMRLEYGTLNHLSREQFEREVALFKAARMSDAEQEALARSYGL